MRKDGCKAKEAGFLIDTGRLDGGDLVPSKALADNVQAARQRGIAGGAVGFAGEGVPDGRDERFLRICQLCLGFGKRAGNSDRVDGQICVSTVSIVCRARCLFSDPSRMGSSPMGSISVHVADDADGADGILQRACSP